MDLRDFNFWARQARAIETIKSIELLRTMREAFGLSGDEYVEKMGELTNKYYEDLGETPLSMKTKAKKETETMKDSRKSEGWEFFRKNKEG